MPVMIVWDTVTVHQLALPLRSLSSRKLTVTKTNQGLSLNAESWQAGLQSKAIYSEYVPYMKESALLGPELASSHKSIAAPSRQHSTVSCRCHELHEARIRCYFSKQREPFLCFKKITHLIRVRHCHIASRGNWSASVRSQEP